jgi:G:T/U-mismatch repair DNA glycosylase
MCQGSPFRTLPDYLRPRLDLLFMGVNPGLYSVEWVHDFPRMMSRFRKMKQTAKGIAK